MNLVSVQPVTVTGNRIGSMNCRPSACTLPGGEGIASPARRRCDAKGGDGKDGHHPDGK